VGAETVSGKIYTKHSIEIVQSNGSKTSTINYIRKDSSGSYFTYVDTTTWGVAAQLRNIGVHFLQSKLDVIFLKDVLHTNEHFYIDYPAHQNGNPVTVRLGGTVLNDNGAVKLHGKVFTNVYIVQLTAEFGKNGVFTLIPSSDPLYFAKGIGFINPGYDGVIEWKIY
jgi:hypothetical protein